MRIITVLSFLLLVKVSLAQSIDKDDLIGNWVLVEETDTFPDDIDTFDETDSNVDSDSDNKPKTTTV